MRNSSLFAGAESHADSSAKASAKLRCMVTGMDDSDGSHPTVSVSQWMGCPRRVATTFTARMSTLKGAAWKPPQCAMRSSPCTIRGTLTPLRIRCLPGFHTLSRSFLSRRRYASAPPPSGCPIPLPSPPGSVDLSSSGTDHLCAAPSRWTAPKWQHIFNINQKK